MRVILSCLALAAVSIAARGQEQLPAGAVLRFGDPALRIHPMYQPALSPDGKLVAYRADRDTLRLADPLTGKTVRDVRVPPGTRIGGDWRFLGSAGDRFLVIDPPTDVRVFDAKAGKVTVTLPKLTQSFWRFATSDDGNVGVEWARDEGQVVLWDLTTGKAIGKLDHGLRERIEASLAGDSKTAVLTGVVVAKKGDEFVREPRLQVRDVKTQKRLAEFPCEKLQRLPALSADGKLIAGNPDGTGATEVRDAATGKVVAEIPEAKGIFFGFTPPYRFSPDNKRLAIRYDIGLVRLWDLEAKKELGATRATTYRMAGVAFDAENNVVACGFYNQAILGWKTPGQDPPRPAGHFGNVVALRFTPDGKHLLSFGSDQRVLRWDAATGKLLETVHDADYSPYEGTSYELLSGSTFSADAKYLFWHTRHRTCAVLDVAARKVLPELTTNTKFAPLWYKAVFAKDSSKLLACGSWYEEKDRSNNAVACAWSLPDCKLLLDTRKKVDKLADRVPTAEAVLREKYADDFPAAGPLEVVSSEAERDPWTTWYLFVGHRVAVRDAKSGKALLDLQTRMYYPNAFALSPDGRRLAVGWNDTSILLFDVPDKLGAGGAPAQDEKVNLTGVWTGDAGGVYYVCQRAGQVSDSVRPAGDR